MKVRFQRCLDTLPRALPGAETVFQGSGLKNVPAHEPRAGWAAWTTHAWEAPLAVRVEGKSGELASTFRREREFSLAAAEAAEKPVQPERTGLAGPRAPRGWGPEPWGGLFPNHTARKWQSQGEGSASSSACLFQELLPGFRASWEQGPSFIHSCSYSFIQTFNKYYQRPPQG